MSRRPELLFASAASLLALVGAVIALELWNADFRAPFLDSGDATLNLLLIKDVIDHPWYFENGDLGAPNDLDLYDYPVINGETLNLLAFRLLALGTDDVALIMNLFFLLTFPLTALTAFLAFRRLPVRREVALAFAVLFALLPYHFLRGEAHLFLAAYYAVPLGAYLALGVFKGDRLVGDRRSLLLTAAMCVVVATASGSGYYAVFTVLLVAAAAVLRSVVQRERAALVVGGAVVAAIAAVSIVQLLPTIANRAVNGDNDHVAKRQSFESELYGLKLTNLLLPVDDHRIGALARRKAAYERHVAPTEARSATLGIIGALGFLWLVGVGLAACAGVGRRFSLGLHAGLAALTVLATLVATTGGFSALFAVVWPQIRSWNRLSVFIAFFSLAAVALLVDALGRRLSRVALAAVLTGIVAVGFLDQTTKAYVPDYPRLEAAWRGEAAFFGSLERRLPEEAMVVQLPYEPFPEPPAAFNGGYEPAKAYLHSDDLRWSYGAMRGRPDDWAAQHTNKPAPQLVSEARRAGFAGLLVDTLPYPDHGVAIQGELRKVLGSEPIRSPSERYLFWRLPG